MQVKGWARPLRRIYGGKADASAPVTGPPSRIACPHDLPRPRGSRDVVGAVALQLNPGDGRFRPRVGPPTTRAARSRNASVARGVVSPGKSRHAEGIFSLSPAPTTRATLRKGRNDATVRVHRGQRATQVRRDMGVKHTRTAQHRPTSSKAGPVEWVRQPLGTKKVLEWEARPNEWHPSEG